jgi:DNA polymerase-3 subunit gamma/tau
MTEGQNPAHFARQFVRFLRNAVVARVAGSDSALLQISSDERARVWRVAQQFTEEDLARFLQIMLRTFDELGYRQEQRFHLELGVLKLVHAQRILPLEQMLSQVAADSPKSAATPRPAPALSQAVTGAPAAAPFTAPKKQEGFASPFEADRARKGRNFDPEMSDGAPRIDSSSGSSVVSQTSTLTSGAITAVAVALENGEPDSANSTQTDSTQTNDDPAEILGQVAQAMEDVDANLAEIMAQGSATLQGNELTVAIDKPASVVPFFLNDRYKPILNKAASEAAGRSLKVKLVGGAPARAVTTNVVRPARTNGNGNGQSARSRAANDPIVRRMQEKFGAEIRTVIDKSEKD